MSQQHHRLYIIREFSFGLSETAAKENRYCATKNRFVLPWQSHVYIIYMCIFLFVLEIGNHRGDTINIWVEREREKFEHIEECFEAMIQNKNDDDLFCHYGRRMPSKIESPSHMMERVNVIQW